MKRAAKIKCVFIKWEYPPADLTSLGHGLFVLDNQRPKDDQIIAFVIGYDWLNGDSSRAVVQVREPDLLTSYEIIEDMKDRLRDGLGFKAFPLARLTPRLEIHANA